MQHNLRALTGIVPPLATPLTSSGKIDAVALHSLVEHVCTAGVNGLFILGTTGEGPSLDNGMRRDVIKAVQQQAGSRVPVLVGLCDTSLNEQLALAEFSATVGAAGLVLTPPCYFALSDAEVLNYLERFTPKLPLPVFLYNIPSLTKIAFAPHIVASAVSLPNVVGLKDSSGNMAYFDAVRRQVPEEFRMFCGPEELLTEAMALGANGGVCGGSNLFPRLYLELYEAARDGRTADAARLQSIVLELSSGVYSVCSGNSQYLRGMKTALHALGLAGGALAEPLSAVSSEESRTIQQFLSRFCAQYGAEFGHVTVA